MIKYFAVLLTLTTTFSFSQNQWPTGKESMKAMMSRMKVGHLYGKVVDSTSNKPVEFASVQLIGDMFDTLTLAIKKDAIVAGQLTKENGDFSLEKINVTGKYKIKIVSMGYQTKEIPFTFGINKGNRNSMNNTDRDLGNIMLSPNTNMLKAVEITSSTPAMELKLDKKVFNVEKDIVSAGGTAQDVLKQVPTVSVDVDGNVTLRNSTPQIFVDGRPTTLTLDQIPADAIKNVEIITNPSAKYDASGGQAGILNLVLKKEKQIGYHGNVRLGIDQYAKINGGADINARESKINVFLSGHFNQRHSLTTGITERKDLTGSPLTNTHQNQSSVNNGYFAMGRGGFDWFKDIRNTLTFSGIYMEGHFDPTDMLATNTDTIFPISGSSSYNRLSQRKVLFKNAGGTFQYKHLFPMEGKELTADINYRKSQYLTHGDYNSQYYNASGNHTGSIFQNMGGSGQNEIITGQSDLVLPLGTKDSLNKHKSKIETGIKWSYRNFSSKTENYLMNDSTGEFMLIKNQSANYNYIDQVYAAYITYGKQLGKFSYQLGLRSESSFYTGELVDSNKTFRNIYPVSLFPSGSFTYDLNTKDNFQFSYSRRINRPSFFQIIPYTDYSDSLNLKRGNAGLKPEFTHLLELSFLKTFNRSNNLLATVYFQNITDLITNYQIQEYDNALHRNAIINTYKNADAAYVYGAELTSKHEIKKWLEFTLNVNAYYSKINAQNIQTDLTNEQFSWFTKENFTFKLPKNISIQISPEYRSKSSIPVSRGDNSYGGYGHSSTSTAQGFIKERYSVDAAVQYQFLKNRAASLSINVRDIFGTDNNETITNSKYFNQTTSRLRDPHFIRINFSYRFGKFDASLFKRKNNQVNTDSGMEIGM